MRQMSLGWGKAVCNFSNFCSSMYLYLALKKALLQHYQSNKLLMYFYIFNLINRQSQCNDSERVSS